MEQLRKGPVTVSGPSFTEALERYTRLRNLEFSRLNFSGLPAIQLRNLARYAGMASARYIARMPEARRLAVLTAFVKAQEGSASPGRTAPPFHPENLYYAGGPAH